MDQKKTQNFKFDNMTCEVLLEILKGFIKEAPKNYNAFWRLND